ncbi:MAG: efflux RND transporter periplasmic adaptor subunit [Pseudomonadota bacterium]
MGTQSRRFLAGLGLTVAAAALAGYAGSRYLASRGDHARSTPAAPSDTTQAHYTCAMHPQILLDHPGNCPICNMRLERSGGADMAGQMDMIQVDQATQQKMGLQLATASVTDMTHAIHAFATIAADDSTTVSVNPKVEGWLRRLYVQGVGQTVRRGQPLYDIYSPELQQRQREYIDLLTRKDGLLGDSMAIVSSNAAMIGSLSKEKFRARERLIAADMGADLVDQLERSRRVQDVVQVRAAHDGVVTTLAMHEGNYVNPMQQILSYADNRSVWAEIALFPDQLEWIHNGDAIVFRSALDKSVQQRARVDTATLQIDPQTRTAKLRVALANPQGAFRPGAFADVDIAAARQPRLSVPRDAVIRTGHGDFVVLAAEHAHFRRARVSTGVENQELVAILSGIQAGDRVAINGQFLLDGAASMQAMQARLDSMAPSPVAAETQHQHPHGREMTP